MKDLHVENKHGSFCVDLGGRSCVDCGLVIVGCPKTGHNWVQGETNSFAVEGEE